MIDIIHYDGTRESVDGPLTLIDMQRTVGGHIKLVPLDGAHLVVNKDLGMYQLPLNEKASRIACRPLFGTVILTNQLK